MLDTHPHHSEQTLSRGLFLWDKKVARAFLGHGTGFVKQKLKGSRSQKDLGADRQGNLDPPSGSLATWPGIQ